MSRRRTRYYRRQKDHPVRGWLTCYCCTTLPVVGMMLLALGVYLYRSRRHS